MSELRVQLAEQLRREQLVELAWRSPRDLEAADLISPGANPAGRDEVSVGLAFLWRRGKLWNMRWTPRALQRLLVWTPKLPSPCDPPRLRSGGNLGAARAHYVAACLGRLGQPGILPLAAATGLYLDRFQLIATPPGQPVPGLTLAEGTPLDRALGRARRLPQAPPSLVRMEGLTPGERELLVRLEQFPSFVAAGRPHRLAAYAQDLAYRMDAFYASTRLLDRALALAVFRASGRVLEAAAYLLGVNDEGEKLCL